MELSLLEAKKIVNSLPIAFYLKKKIAVKVSEIDEASNTDFAGTCITVSLKQLNRMLSSLADGSKEVETLVRSMVYHEVSHALLTPKKLYKYIYKTEEHDIINCFEDERIETICKNVYANTDFNKAIHTICKGPIDDNAFNFFFKIVRLQDGPKDLISKTNELIKKYATLNANTEALFDYTSAVLSFYKVCKDRYDKLHPSKDKDRSDEEDKKNIESKEKVVDAIIDKSSIKIEAADVETEAVHVEVMTDDETNHIFKKDIDEVVGIYENDKIEARLKKCLDNFKSLQHRNGSAIASYSGMFSPRNILRDDYKYFIQSNRFGNYKAFSKFHLTLVIDNSGSFYRHEKDTNSLLQALLKLSKTYKDFSFDVITCGYGEKKLDVENEQFTTCGGNYLTSDIFKLLKDCKKPEQVNKTVVMFDGDAFSAAYSSERKEHTKNFEAFNNKDSYIISDYDNEDAINEYCKNAAKKVFTADYAAIFKDIVLDLISEAMC